MKAEYREMLKSLEREAYTSSLTAGVVTLFVFSPLLLAAAFVLAGKNTQSGLPVFIISLVGGGAGLFGALGWYVTKAREYMRAGSVELELSHPGFYDYYREWQDRIERITSGFDLN